LLNPKNSTKQATELVLGLLRAGLSNPPIVPNSLRGAFKEALDMASAHQIAPALCSGLRHLANKDSAWSDLVPFVQLIETQNRLRNEKIETSAIKIAALFRSADISCVFLKGTAMVLESKNYAPWRLVTDLDILVPPDCIGRAVSSLLQHGYHQRADYAGFEEGIHHHYPALSDDESNTLVELHVRLMQDQSGNPLQTVDIFQRATPLKRNAQIFLVPCPEHRMIHLIAHAQLSNWGFVLRQITLKDVVDALKLNARNEIDWEVVRKAFIEICAEKELMGFLYAARLLLGLSSPFPEADLTKGKDWAERAVEALYAPSGKLQTFLRIISHYVTLFSRDPHRIRILAKTLKDPARLKHLLTVNRERLRVPGQRKDFIN